MYHLLLLNWQNRWLVCSENAMHYATSWKGSGVLIKIISPPRSHPRPRPQLPGTSDQWVAGPVVQLSDHLLCRRQPRWWPAQPSRVCCQQSAALYTPPQPNTDMDIRILNIDTQWHSDNQWHVSTPASNSSHCKSVELNIVLFLVFDDDFRKVTKDLVFEC